MIDKRVFDKYQIRHFDDHYAIFLFSLYLISSLFCQGRGIGVSQSGFGGFVPAHFICGRIPVIRVSGGLII